MRYATRLQPSRRCCVTPLLPLPQPLYITSRIGLKALVRGEHHCFLAMSCGQSRNSECMLWFSFSKYKTHATCQLLLIVTWIWFPVGYHQPLEPVLIPGTLAHIDLIMLACRETSISQSILRLLLLEYRSQLQSLRVSGSLNHRTDTGLPSM